jgi:hypothetical protein
MNPSGCSATVSFSGIVFSEIVVPTVVAYDAGMHEVEETRFGVASPVAPALGYLR